jgi:hypothetical protein
MRGRGGGGTVPLSSHPDMVVYLPSNTDDYSGSYLTSPGRRNIPANLPPWSSFSEKKFIDSLIEDLNKNMLAGRDQSIPKCQQASDVYSHQDGIRGSCSLCGRLKCLELGLFRFSARP